jgi:hypothetical protein
MRIIDDDTDEIAEPAACAAELGPGELMKPSIGLQCTRSRSAYYDFGDAPKSHLYPETGPEFSRTINLDSTCSLKLGKRPHRHEDRCQRYIHNFPPAARIESPGPVQT